MAAYKGTTLITDAVQVEASKIEYIASNFTGYKVNNGQLYSPSGTIVNNGIWIVRFENGTIKQFSDDLFKLMFTKIEPPTYKLSDIDTTRNIKRKGWDGLYLAYNGFCFVQYDADGPVVPYTFTDSDIAATDWMVVEE